MQPYYADVHVTLYHANALDVLPTLQPESIDCLMTDPPYSSEGRFKGDRAQVTGSKYSHVQKGTDVFSGDNRDQRSFGFWLTLCLMRTWPLLCPGAAVGLFSDWRQLPSVTDVLQAAGLVWRGIGVWDKTEGARPNKGAYRNQAEYVVWGSRGPLTTRPVVYLPGVWRMPYVAAKQRVHFAEKHLALMRELLRIARPGATILDPFAGGGTTLVAAKECGLQAIGCELMERHAETAARRLERTRADEGMLA